LKPKKLLLKNPAYLSRIFTRDRPLRDLRGALLSLFRSVSIFLFKAQAKRKGGKQSLPDFERHVHRKPWGLIRRFTQSRHEE
jgi:hypothetical protein